MYHLLSKYSLAISTANHFTIPHRSIFCHGCKETLFQIISNVSKSKLTSVSASSCLKLFR
ncbi:MAG: hypothetical protein WCG25_04665 [bacterium]